MTDTFVGVAPLDLTTQVGQLRALLGDTIYVPTTPPATGMGEYQAFSDVNLSGFLAMSGGVSIPNAAGYAFLQYAASIAPESVKLSTADLSLDLTQRAKFYTDLANIWFARGASELQLAASDFWGVIPGPGTSWSPELAPWPQPWAGLSSSDWDPFYGWC